MTTKELAEKLQALIKETMEFEAEDAQVVGIHPPQGEEAIVLSRKGDASVFILHILKIESSQHDSAKRRKSN